MAKREFNDGHWVELTQTAHLAQEFFNLNVRETPMGRHVEETELEIAAKFEAASAALYAAYSAVSIRAAMTPDELQRRSERRANLEGA